MGKLSNILKAAATGSFTLLLAACYGAAYEQETMSGKVTITNDGGRPIKGLSLNLIKNQIDLGKIQVTDESGMAEWGGMDTYSEYSLKIMDTDGPENGGEFVMKEIPLEPNTPGGDFEETISLDEI